MSEDLNMLKELIEIKLDGLVTKIDANHQIQKEISNSILIQAKTTNSRVNHLEEDVNDLKEDFLIRPDNCPVYKDIVKIDKRVDGIADKIDVIQKSITIFDFMIEHPKLTLLLITIFTSVLIASAILTMHPYLT